MYVIYIYRRSNDEQMSVNVVYSKVTCFTFSVRGIRVSFLFVKGLLLVEARGERLAEIKALVRRWGVGHNQLANGVLTRGSRAIEVTAHAHSELLGATHGSWVKNGLAILDETPVA